MKYYFFSFYGSYLGYVDEGGNFYDGEGHRWAQLVGGCKVYGLDGAYRGYVNAQGSYFEPQGGCRGYLRDWVAAKPGPTIGREPDGPPGCSAE